MSQRKRALAQQAFLASYRTMGNILHAAAAAGIDRKMHYRWIKDPGYAEQFADAEGDAIDVLEAEARRRAVEGVEEPTGWFKGEPGGYVRRYSDTLLIFLLKGARPEVYRERFEHTGKDGAPLVPQTIRFGDRDIEF